MQRNLIWLAVFNHLLVFLVVFSGWSCQKDETQATQSLKGEWEVISTTSFYGNFIGNRFDVNERVDESGSLGTFTFQDDLVQFSLTRNDTLYEFETEWGLEADKVRAGFFRETQFTLFLKDTFQFDVEFERGTRNAEKNANSATFFYEPEHEGAGVAIEMELEKLE